MRSLPVLAAVAAVVAAGCAGVAGPAAGPPAVTPAPVPEGSPTPFVAPVRLAPGVTSAGVDDPAALAEAHGAALANGSFTRVEATTVVALEDAERTDDAPTDAGPVEPLVASRSVTRVGAGGSPRSTLRAVDGPLAPPVAVGPGGDHPAVPAPATVATWTDGAVRYWRVVGDGRVVHAVAAGDGPSALETGLGTPYRDLLSAVLVRASASAHPAGLVQLAGRRDRLDPGTPYPMDDRITSPRDLHLEVELSPAGVVLEFELRYRGALDGRPVVVEHDVDLRDRGSTSVGRPAWFDDAGNASR